MGPNKKLSDTNSLSSGITPGSLDSLFSGLETDKLPSLPHILVVLLDASHTEVISFDRLSELFKSDPALSARIVGAASAACYGGQGKFLTFERTLVLLGLDSIKTIAITASVQQFFSRFDSAGSRRLKRFWRRSLNCAYIAKSLARLTGYDYGDEAYLAGLMHDIGELVFANNYPDEVESIITQAESREQLLAMETETFGGHRGQAGAWLVAGWDLDSFMADAICYQDVEVDEMQDAHPLVKIIYLASKLARLSGEIDDAGLMAAEQLFDLNHSLVRDLCSDAQGSVEAAAKSMGIDIDVAEQELAEYQDAASDDEEKQIELADRVRNIALLDGVRQQLGKSQGEAEVLNTIQKGLNILFATRASGFFLFDEDQQHLQGQAGGDSSMSLAEFTIGLDSRCLVARSLREKIPVSTEAADQTTPVSVLDRQLATLLGTSQFVCLPLVVDRHRLGVLITACKPTAGDARERQMRLLGMFANEAAYSLLTARQRNQDDLQRADEDREYYHARAREIVHEVSNPLTIIKNYVHILGTKLQDGVYSRELELIREELERAGDILIKLPGIADQAKSGSGAELADINTLVADLMKVFRASLFASNHIESFTDLAEQMLPIACDRSALKQVLTNLVKNAAEAVAEAGRVEVATRGLVNFNGKNFVEIVVRDNGPGIPDDVQAKLFTPVESTKGGSHAGLGLTIVKNLVDGMGGYISCRSSATDGTRFEILIPRVLE